MINTLQKIGVGIATSALFASLAVNAFAANTITISGNGAGSTNKSVAKSTTSAKVTQSSKTTVLTFVGQVSNTGGNTANKNTGGTTTITSGSATTSTTVDVTGGDNSATTPTCCCDQAPVDNTVTITGNGADSTNTAINKSSCKQSVKQTNKTTVVTGVFQAANTGDNTAKKNTDGDVSITSGDVSNTVGVTVTGGGNTTP